MGGMKKRGKVGGRRNDDPQNSVNIKPFKPRENMTYIQVASSGSWPSMSCEVILPKGGLQDVVEVKLSSCTVIPFLRDRCLVGTLAAWTGAVPSAKEIENWCSSNWGIGSPVEVKDMNGPVYLIVLPSRAEARRICNRCWNFEGTKVDLICWEDRCGCYVDKNKPEAVWVRVFGIPVFLWSEELFRVLSDRCGGYITTAEETMSRNHVKWARICVSGSGTSIPVTVSIGMGSLMMGKEVVGGRYDSSAQRDRGANSRSIGATCAGKSNEFFENEQQRPRPQTICGLCSNKPGQRPNIHAVSDKTSEEKEKGSLTDVTQGESLFGMQYGGESEAERSNSTMDGRVTRTAWTIERAEEDLEGLSEDLDQGQGQGHESLPAMHTEEINWERDNLAIVSLDYNQIEPIVSASPGDEGFNKFLGISYGGLEDEAARLFARIEEQWKDRASTRGRRSREMGGEKVEVAAGPEGSRKLVQEGRKLILFHMKSKMLSWNTRGLNDPDKRKVVKGLLNRWKCSVVCLQETKLKVVNQAIVQSLWGGRWVAWECKRAEGLAGGRLGGLHGFGGGGDFNVVRHPSERTGRNRSSSAMKDFVDYIMEEELIDLPLEGACFTWSNGLVSSRLDRFLVSPKWEGDHLDVRQFCLPRIISDHKPMVLVVGGMHRGPAPFRFENMWLESISSSGQEAAIVEVGPEKVEHRDDNLPRPTPPPIGREVTVPIVVPPKILYGEVVPLVPRVETKVATLTEELQALESKVQSGELFDAERDLMAELQAEIGRLLMAEETSWRQKSRAIWLAAGDRNTTFFHRVANAHRRSNYIGKFRVDRILHEDQDALASDIVGFYEKLYKEPEQWRLKVDGLRLPSLSMEEVDSLVRPFGEEEVSEVVMQMRGDKVPGPDGFSIAFLQHCCLIGCIYKVLAKVLAGRMAKMMDRLISENQNAFVGGRQILDVSLVANECVDWRLRSTDPGVLCFFGGSRGLRQGDPLSPLLFIIVMDVLSRFISRVVSLGRLSGFKVGEGSQEVTVSHLMFADDTLILCKEDSREMACLRDILLCFQAVSSLNLIWRKASQVGDDSNLRNFFETLGCKCNSGSLPTSYLGLPLGSHFKSKDIWGAMVDRFEKRLVAWKRQYLSKGGKLTLIKSTLSCMPTYFLSLFTIPKSMASRLEKLMRDFLWNQSEKVSGFHLVAWKDLCLSKKRGGLGIRDLVLFNKALLGKWIWRFALKEDKMWCRVIKGNWGKTVKFPFGMTTGAIKCLFGIDVHPISQEVDRWWWKRQGKGKFLVSSFYHSLSGIGDPSFPWKGIWVSRVPSEVCFFGWAAARGAILTIDNLRRRRMVAIEWCYMCKRSAETSDHLLINCDYAREVWSLVFSIFGVQWVMPISIRELFACWDQESCRGSRQIAWRVAPLCFV
ncbi:GATA transcription factor 15 [Actinidia rufa]|uniref:GATA transcription factor 15 n=1 Tax=Actinidia rufa TaxID=165716 RepID=A0A7J0GQJ0_9ERIC|nr:GATA transcription factor 15 [Actinidia rufa]